MTSHRSKKNAADLTCCLLLLDGRGQGGAALHSSGSHDLRGRHGDDGGRGGRRGGCHGDWSFLDALLGRLGGNGHPAVLIQLPLHRALYLSSAEEEERPSANQSSFCLLHP